MADLETTQSKLRSTPTAGVAGEHSAYYRRLLSAGYKGYIQGSIGGATLYGALGLGIGLLVGLPLLAFSSSALLLIPALGGLGAIHGAHTFADIGKTAAIIAESADTNEKRRYLLDRYYETPSDEEAKTIKGLLENQLKPQPAGQMFHWKTVLVGAILGAAMAGGIFLLAATPMGIALPFMPEIAGFLSSLSFGGNALAVGAVGAAIGTAAGGLIGLDREYIRRWLDGAETIVNDPTRAQQQLAAREQEVNSLAIAARRDTNQQMARSAAPEAMKINMAEPSAGALSTVNLSARPAPISPEAIAGLKEKPSVQVTGAQLNDRVHTLQEALSRPVV